MRPTAIAELHNPGNWRPPPPGPYHALSLVSELSPGAIHRSRFELVMCIDVSWWGPYVATAYVAEHGAVRLMEMRSGTMMGADVARWRRASAASRGVARRAA